MITRIGKNIHRNIIIERNLQSHILLIQGADPQTETSLEAIASALHASLVRTAFGYSIERTKADRAIYTRIRLDAREQWLRDKLAALSKFRNRIKEDGGLDAAVRRAEAEEYTSRQTFSRSGVDTTTGLFAVQLLPPEVLLEGLIERIGLRTLASIPSGEEVVFEDSPGPLAFDLPEHHDLLEEYAKDPGLQIDGSLHANVEGGGILTDRLRLRVRSAPQVMQFRLEGFDGAGNRNLHSYFEAGPTIGVRHPKSIMAGVLANGSAVLAHLSTKSISALRFIQNSDLSDGQPKAVSAGGQPEWLLSPDKDDPLGLFVGDICAALLANEPGAFRVMDLSDEMWTVLTPCTTSDGRYSLAAAEECLREWIPYQTIHTYAYTVLRPLDPEFEEKRLASRTTLRKYANTASPTYVPSFREVAEFIHTSISEDSPLPFEWLSLCDPSRRMPASMRGLSRSFYDLIGAISDSDWEDLLAGKKKSLSDLGVMNEALRLFRISKPAFPRATESDQPNIYQYIPELADLGPLEGTSISIRREATPMFRPGFESVTDMQGWGTLDQFSRRFALHGDAVKIENGRATLQITQTDFEAKRSDVEVQVGTADNLVIRFYLPADAMLSESITQGFHAEDGLVRYSMLPQTARDQIWSFVASRAIDPPGHLIVTTRFSSNPAKGPSGSRQP